MPAGRFTPTSSPYATNKTGVKLTGNEVLHFQPGKGYYAGPPVAAAAAPAADGAPAGLSYLTPAQIATQAGTTARGQITAMAQPILDQQRLDAQQFAGQRAQTQGFNTAAMRELGTIGPQVQAGYTQAAQQEGALAGGVGDSFASSLADSNRAAAEFAAAHGAAGSGGPSAVDPSSFGSALKYGNGFIPGQSLLAQGAHANQWAAGTKAVAHAGAVQDVLATNTTEAKAQAQSAQHIATLAAKYPSLFSAEEHSLIKQNADTYKLAQGDRKLDQADTKLNVDANYKAGILAYYNHGQTTRDIVAANQAAYDQATITERTAYHAATITARTEANRIALKKAQQAGHQIDKGASLATGVITFKDGTMLKGKDGTPVAVDPRAYSSSKDKTGAKSVFGKMVADARRSAGKPLKNTAGFGGMYILGPGMDIGPTDTASPGPGFPATTDDPNRAQKGQTSTFAEMVTALSAQYAAPRSQARKALIKAGWKPDGKRTSRSGPAAPGQTVPGPFGS